MTRPPHVTRWRCLVPDCPDSRWQHIDTLGECDPVDVACEEIERHWRDKHGDDYGEQEARAAA